MSAADDLTTPPLPPEAAVDVEPFDPYALGRAFTIDQQDWTPEQFALHDRVTAYGIPDDAEAEWAMRHLVVMDRAILKADRDMEAWCARLKAHHRKATEHVQVAREVLADKLVVYALKRREETGAATLTLPSGEAATRSAKATVVVADPDEMDRDSFPEREVIAWARQHLEGEALDEVVKVAESVRIGKLRNHVKVAERVDHLRVTLDCGPVRTLPAIEHVAVGELLPCPRAEHDHAMAAVSEVVAVTVLEAQDAEGNAVPGLTVEPAKVTATVKPDLSAW